MNNRITTAAALAALLAACTQKPPANEATESAAGAGEAAAALAQRAGSAAGANGQRLGETLPPFRIAGNSLGGTEPFPWGTAVNRSLVTAVFPAESPPRATMEFEKANGSIAVTMSQANGWHFYFECDARPVGNPPSLWFNWVVDMTPNPQVRNRATYDPATRKWFFVTPVANAPENGRFFVTFWAAESGAPADSHWMLHGCDVLPFKVAA